MATLDRCLPGAGEEIPSVTRREDGATGIPAADCRRLPEGDIKHQIANVVKPVMQGYKFQSVKEFKALLGLFHVTVEEAHKTIKERPIMDWSMRLPMKRRTDRRSHQIQQDR